VNLLHIVGLIVYRRYTSQYDMVMFTMSY